MYKITTEKTKKSKGRVSILRNVEERGRNTRPYATYHIFFEKPDKKFTIDINRKMEVINASSDINLLIKENGFSNVQEFADNYRDFKGFSE